MESKQTAVEWLENKIDIILPLEIEWDKLNNIFQQAKQMEKEQKIELLKWRETRFTKDAPLEYVLSEFEKL